MVRKSFASLIISAVLLLAISFSANAKVWRINNTPGVNKDFADPGAAIASASVVNGDTLYIEASATAYGGFTLSKRLVIIGTGYFLSGANSNPGLQASSSTSGLGGNGILFDSTGSGSVLMGLSNFFMGVGPNLGTATDNITVTRCLFSGMGTYYGITPNTVMDGWKINKCYISNQVGDPGFVTRNWAVSNNICTGYMNLNHAGSLDNIVRNNVIMGVVTLNKAYFANNIIYNTFNVVDVTVKNNLAIGNPGGFATYAGTNGNVSGLAVADIFQGLTGNSTDGQYRLKPGSPGIGAGLTVGSVVSPDCGAFGGPDPYVLSGIPGIPTIYSLTVPASVPAGTTTMNVTFSTKNNN